MKTMVLAHRLRRLPFEDMSLPLLAIDEETTLPHDLRCTDRTKHWELFWLKQSGIPWYSTISDPVYTNGDRSALGLVWNCKPRAHIRYPCIIDLVYAPFENVWIQPSSYWLCPHAMLGRWRWHRVEVKPQRHKKRVFSLVYSDSRTDRNHPTQLYRRRIMTFVHGLGKTNERHTPLAKNAIVGWVRGITAVAAFSQFLSSVWTNSIG